VQRLINITESVDKIERLLGIHTPNGGGDGPSHAGFVFYYMYIQYKTFFEVLFVINFVTKYIRNDLTK
jgi:hypothetical protein